MAVRRVRRAYYCPSCGKRVGNGKKRCRNCWYKTRSSKRPYPSH